MVDNPKKKKRDRLFESKQKYEVKHKRKKPYKKYKHPGETFTD